MAFRFRDVPEVINAHVLAYLNGEVAKHCVEVCPAPCGFVVVCDMDERGLQHPCACGRGIAMRLLVGNVAMTLKPVPRKKG